MNILQILPELNIGGVEIGTLDLAKHLVKLGHKAVVVSNGGELAKELESYGAIHYQLPVHRKSVFAIIRMIPPLVKIIKKEQIDIVHARSRVPAWIAFFAARSTNTVFITTCHGYYKKHLFSYVMGWAKRVIVLSNVIGRHMIDDFGIPYERIRLIPRSVDLDKFKYTSPDKKKRRDFNVGIIGRITPIKGHLHFIKAMAKAARVVPHLKIWIVGDASASRQAYKDQLRLLVKRLGLSHATEFLSTSRDIPAILANLNLLVLATTTHEAFGRVIVEAQASGVPVVATRVGGVIDIIEDKKTGLLVPPADPDSMSEAVIKIFKDIELSCNLAQNAYNKVKEKYTVQLMVKNTLDVYEEALSNRKLLIIKLGSLGDVILSTAAIRAIKEKFGPSTTLRADGEQSRTIADKYPECSVSSKSSIGMPKRSQSSSRIRHKISFLIGEESKDVLLQCPYIDELLVYDFKNRDKGIRGFLRISNILRKKNFDLVIDLQNNRKSHLLSFLTLSLNRYGYDNRKFGFLLNQRIKDKKPAIEPVIHQFRILKNLGIELEDSHLELWPQEKDRHYIDEFLNLAWLSTNQRIIGINISASQRWPTKNWPLHYIIKLTEELSRRDMRVVITGTEKDLDSANTLMDNVNNIKPINACAKTTINQLACLIKKCAIYISPDSASLHIAAAVGVPFIALFGPTDPRRHLPPGENYAVLKKDLPCSSCYKSKCRTKRCMELIKPEEVLEAIDKLLA